MQEVKKEISALLFKAKENYTPIEITSNDLCQLFANNMEKTVYDNLPTISLNPLYSINSELYRNWHRTFMKVLSSDDRTIHLYNDMEGYIDKISPIVDNSFKELHLTFISEVLKQQEKDKQEIENLKEMLRLFVQGTKTALESLEKTQ
jgi:hypothetical protein